MKIFVSHSNKDNKIVKRIVNKFDEYDVEYWVDDEVLRGDGHAVNREINNGLESSTHFLLIWSKDAKASEFVQDEHEIATSPDYNKILKKIIFRLDDTRLPPLLARIKYRREINDQNVEIVIRDVIKNILKIDVDLLDEFDSIIDDSNEEIKLMDAYYPLSKVLKCADKKEY